MLKIRLPFFLYNGIALCTSSRTTLPQHSPLRHKLIAAPTPHSQVRSKEEQEREAPKALFTVSRRDTLLYLAAVSLSGVTLMSTRPVEARVGKIENKRKAMKKLEKLREKAEEKTTQASNTPATNAVAISRF
ncbi:hypothetical protein TEA_001750 [Camellia sinensis var. sinensis]|uniref:Uncharacterized protein n=1 Tax=Camellia sinensis var. sinensis TaxID=542762 RepID=A0A4S4D8M5_CAMSN|nr:hypothetical protein TEA_001750 [Camellia sinensis var. sinensis]